MADYHLHFDLGVRDCDASCTTNRDTRFDQPGYAFN